jgi:hypothetical protein
MTKISVDTRGVALQPSARGSSTVAHGSRKRGSFDTRIAARRVDLVQLLEEGIPSIEYLPASEGMLVRGKRHLIAAPQKTGKSIGMEAHWVDMVLAGATVAVLDRENGRELYARRLAGIMDARSLTKKRRKRVQSKLHYYDFPELRPNDADALASYFASVDLVVFDSQRMFLSDYGLQEKDSDDYAEFMSYAVDPLFRAHVATLILDNTGHNERTRPRGASTKGDLNEILFSMDTVSDFDLHKKGKLKLKVERSRLGNVGEWTMEIGAGHFGSWELANAQHGRADFRAAILDILSDGKALGQDKLCRAVRVRGVHVSNAIARGLLDQYTTDAETPIRHTPTGYSRTDL